MSGNGNGDADQKKQEAASSKTDEAPGQAHDEVRLPLYARLWLKEKRRRYEEGFRFAMSLKHE